MSLQIGYPTVASVPHSIVNGFKVTYSYPLSSPHANSYSQANSYFLSLSLSLSQNLLAVAVATDITFKEAEQVFFLYQFVIKISLEKQPVISHLQSSLN